MNNRGRIQLEAANRRLRPSHAEPGTERPVIVLANRAPFRHERDGSGHIAARRSGGGLVTALEPMVEACAGTWVASSAGACDRDIATVRDGVRVPATSARYRLRYVWLTNDEQRGYYWGFANEGLWPLCHAVHVRPIFREPDFQMYAAVNARFADAVAEEARGRSPIVLVQDYHFALAPRFVRRRMSNTAIVSFWHIPWPPARVFKTCPRAVRLLDGLLGSDVVGFQTREDCRNFLDSVEAVLDAAVNIRHGTITYRGRDTSVRTYPVGVEWASRTVCATPSPDICRARVFRRLGLSEDAQLGVGVDRLDYTKGIEEKLLAVERLLAMNAEFRDRFVFVQIAEPSRECLPAYRATREQIVKTSARVNERFGTGSYRPISLIETHHDPADVYELYRAADLCYVGSLHDGMNLVAKEFISARDDERGVLVLSEFTGAARQLANALIVNPYAIDRVAHSLAEALSMPAPEQARRMRLLRANVAGYDAGWWARQMLDAVSMAGSLRSTEAQPPPVQPIQALA